MRLNRLVLFLILLIPIRAWANVVGADTQNFNPTTNGLDFVTVHSSETLQPGLLNAGFFLNFAVNSLPEFESTSGASRTNFKDTLTSSDLNFGLGLTRNWDVGLSFPSVVAQDVEFDDTVTKGNFASTGLTEVRVNSKFKFFGDQNGGLAAVISANFNQILDNPYAGEGEGPTVNYELAYDWTYRLVNMAINAGYRARNPGEALAGSLVEPLPSQYIASVAASYLFDDIDTKLIGEIFGAFPSESIDNASDRALSSGEVLVGVKHDLTQALALHAGAGTELSQGTSSPDWRVYSGLNYVFGPLWQKEEGLVRVDTDSYAALSDGSPDVFTGSPRTSETFVGKDILFETGSAIITPGFEKTLQSLVKYLNQPPPFRSLVIEGHTDSVGKAAYNLDLSRRRAESVRTMLVKYGLPSSKIVAVGFGEGRPIADNGNFQGRALNRRVEFQVNR